MKQRRLLFPLLLLTANIAFAQQKAFHVYFAPGSAALDRTAGAHLDSLVYRDLLNDGATWNVTGYADKPGTASLNDSLSLQRAKAVADYLVGEGFLSRKKVVSVKGEGAAAASGEDPRFRRVDIVMADRQVDSPRQAGGLGSQMAALRVNESVALRNLNFYSGTAAFIPGSDTALKDLLLFMQQHLCVRIMLEGHICCPILGHRSPNALTKGMSNYEYAPVGESLSLSRAKAVYDFLLSNGIAAARMEYQGFGHTKLKIWPERSVQDQDANRRVEVRIISQ